MPASPTELDGFGVELVPGRDVCDVVGGVAVRDPVGDRHRTVGGDREDEQLRNDSTTVTVTGNYPDADGRRSPVATPGPDRPAVSPPWQG